MQRSTGETKESKAQKRLAKFLKDADTPRFVAPDAERFTFEELVALLRKDYAKNRRKSRLRLGHLIAHFAGWKALAITTQKIDEYVEIRQAAGAQGSPARPAAPATINRELAALKRMFQLAVEKTLLPRKPSISLLPEDNVRQGFLDPPEFLAFEAALRARDADVADATAFAYRTALRRANVLGAVWSWFTLDVEDGHVVGGRMTIPGTKMKNRKALSLPLQGDLLSLIDRRFQHRRRHPEVAHVFHRAGRPIVRFDRAWREAAAAIGRPDLLFHDLRRSAARMLRRAGIDAPTIMRLGGWKTTSMFDRYSVVDDRDLDKAQAAIDQALKISGARTVVPLRQHG